MGGYINYEKLKLVENRKSIKKAYASDCYIKKIKGTEYHVPLPTRPPANSLLVLYNYKERAPVSLGVIEVAHL